MSIEFKKINRIEVEMNEDGNVYRISLDRLIFDRDHLLLLDKNTDVSDIDYKIEKCREVGAMTFAEIDGKKSPLDILREEQNGTTN